MSVLVSRVGIDWRVVTSDLKAIVSHFLLALSLILVLPAPAHSPLSQPTPPAVTGPHRSSTSEMLGGCCSGVLDVSIVQCPVVTGGMMCKEAMRTAIWTDRHKQTDTSGRLPVTSGHLRPGISGKNLSAPAPAIASGFGGSPFSPGPVIPGRTYPGKTVHQCVR
jgi:hypothetical protein